MTSLPLYDESDNQVSEPTEQKPILQRSVKLRLPPLDKELSKPERIDQIEDHIWSLAVVRGELAEMRLNANIELKLAQDKWDTMQVAVTGKSTPTEAKRRVNPQLDQKLKDSKWMVQRCSEEIARLDRDQEAASRLYTTITGS